MKIRSRFPRFFVSLILASLASHSSFSDSSDPGALSSTTPSPSESGLPEKIDRKEARKLRRAFIDLLDQEREKLRAEQSRTRKEADAERKARRKEWDVRETAARRKFFEENSHGPERRTYVRDFNDRRRAFYDLLRMEEKQQRAELDARWKSLKDTQKGRLDELEAYLKRMERPPNRMLEKAY